MAAAWVEAEARAAAAAWAAGVAAWVDGGGGRAQIDKLAMRNKIYESTVERNLFIQDTANRSCDADVRFVSGVYAR